MLKKIIITLIVGVVCSFLALLLKWFTEFLEYHIFNIVSNGTYVVALIAVPCLGLLLIWLLNSFIFKGAASKGITEVLDAIEQRKAIPPIKIVTHFLSGLFTVSTGGSTGIEVSAVISSSGMGSLLSRIIKDDNFRKHLIMAGAAAGIAALFNSPLGGLFFAIEVLASTVSLELIGVIALAIVGSAIVTWAIDPSTLFQVITLDWRWKAIPYYMAFSVLTAILSIYLTKLVILTKTFFVKNFQGVKRVFSGGLLTGICVFLFLPLFGEGYHTIQELLSGNSGHILAGILSNNLPDSFLLLALALLLLIKPLATSLTLGAGGDGGVFAPSLFLGATAGLFFSHSLNVWLSTDLIEVNFIIVGMSAILGATIHAPLTAIFITASITGSYVLVVPLMLTSILSKVISKKILPYTVYSYARFKVG